MKLPGIPRPASPRSRRPAVALAAALLAVALAAPALAAGPGLDLGRDSVLAGLVREALANRPELARAEATVQADLARVPQVRALPDPVVSFGVQNDGFDRLRLGEMETSYWSVSAAQTFPLPGKRGLRVRAQSLGAKQSEADLQRARLSVRAEVERAYLDLLLVRDQLRILDRLESLWTQAEELSRSRYETGEGAQSDILRAQLERSRLRQRRWALEAEEGRRRAELNRAAGRAFDAPVATTLSLADLADPAPPDSATAVAEAEARSPELLRARLAVEQSGALLSLARRDIFPDLTVSGGVMPRGSDFDPMWQAGVSVSVPLWAGSRQSAAVRESRQRNKAAESDAETVRRLVRQRLHERRVILAALLESNRLYREGILVQSEATVTSTMAQFQVGRAPFASVLEALGGFLSDLTGFHESVAAIHRLDIAQREISLDPVAASPAGGATGASMTGSGGMGAASAPSGGAAAQPAAPAGSSPSAMPRM